MIFNFELVYLQYFDGDAPWSLSYGVYISLLIRFARLELVHIKSIVSSKICDKRDDF